MFLPGTDLLMVALRQLSRGSSSEEGRVVGREAGPQLKDVVGLGSATATVSSPTSFPSPKSKARVLPIVARLAPLRTGAIGFGCAFERAFRIPHT